MGLKKPMDVERSIQVETLKFEEDVPVQVGTLPTPLRSLMSRNTYLYELLTALREFRGNLDSLEEFLRIPTPQQGSQGLQTVSTQLTKLITSCQSSVELTKHLSALMVKGCHVSEVYAWTQEVQKLSARYDQLLERAHAREQEIRDLNESVYLACQLCWRRNWQCLDNDLWRLEQWLQYAEETQSSQPTHIKSLEDIIQDHRKFFMDLQNLNSIVVSLETVRAHLADHTDFQTAHKFRARLVITIGRWDDVCREFALRHTELQTALMQNHEFHRTIEELVEWVEQTEIQIRQTEPIDLGGDFGVLVPKYFRILELTNYLERCKPRVMGLLKAADLILREAEAPEGGTHIWNRLKEVELKFQYLRRLADVYVVQLGAILGRDPSVLRASVESGITGRSTAATSLRSLSQEFLDQGASGDVDGSVHCEKQHGNDDVSSEQDMVDTSVLTRGFRFLGRVLRASLPVHVLMLLLLVVAKLVSTGEEDYLCYRHNALTRTFEPVLRYPNAPPPT